MAQKKKKALNLNPKSLQTVTILLEEQAKFEKPSVKEKSQGKVNRKQPLCWAKPGSVSPTVAHVTVGSGAHLRHKVLRDHRGGSD